MSMRVAATRQNLLALGTVLSLLVAALLSGAAWIAVRTGHHSWDGGAARHYVHVTSGKVYRISVPDGVKNAALQPAGTAPTCTYRTPGLGVDQSLTVSPEYSSTKATTVVASFAAPVTGRVEVDCEGLGRVYVDNADDAGFDWGTLLLVLASIAWLAFVSCGMSFLWRLRQDHPHPPKDSARPPEGEPVVLV